MKKLKQLFAIAALKWEIATSDFYPKAVKPSPKLDSAPENTRPAPQSKPAYPLKRK